MECTDIHALPPDLTSRIPAELVLHILDEAGDDQATLWACLYVCQAWYVLLIPRLYERIHLHRRAELDKLASAARAHSAVRARLASTCSVTLSRRKRHEPRFAHAFPLVLGPYLRGVAHLAFRACLLRPLHPSFFAALSQLTNVRHLELVKFYLGSFYELQRVICAFPLLEEVHLAESRMRPRTRQQVAPLPPNHQGPSTSLRAPRLAVLRVNKLEADVLRDLVAWMSGTASLSSTKTLEISQHLWNDEDAGPVGALLVHTAATVEHLRLKNAGFGIGSRPGHHFERCIHLRTLDVTLTYSQMVTSKDIARGLHDVLSSLASPTLQKIHLELDVGVIAAPGGRDLQVQDVPPGADADAALHEDLHAILTRAIFAHLTHATIVLTSRRKMPKDSGNAEGLVEGVLALLRALFTPWRRTRCGGRDIATLVGGIWGSGKYFGAVDTGACEETCWLSGQMDKYAENPLLARLGHSV